MQIYLDTANINEIREAASWGILSGVTTNPTIFATALSQGHVYEEQVAQLAASGASTDEAGSTRMLMLASCPSVSGSDFPSARTSARLDDDSTIRRDLKATGWM